MLIHKTPLIGLLALGSCLSMHAQDSTAAQMKAAQLRAALAEAPALPLKREEVDIHLPSPDAVLGGRIVSIATDRKGELNLRVSFAPIKTTSRSWCWIARAISCAASAKD